MPGTGCAVALEAGNRRQVRLRRRMADQRGGDERRIAGVEAEQEQQDEPEKDDERHQHDDAGAGARSRCSFATLVTLLPSPVPSARRRARGAGAARHAPHFEIGEPAPLRAVIEHHPGDQAADDHERRRHKTPTMKPVWLISRVHRQLAALACISCSVRTRRRKISLRIAASSSVTNNSVNATAMMSSGMRIVG